MKKNIIKIIACIVIGFLAAAFVELLYNIDLLRLPEESTGLIPLEYTQEEGAYVASFDSIYVDKYRVVYEAEGPVSFETTIMKTSTGTPVSYNDNNHMFIRESIHKVADEISRLEIVVSPESGNVTIKGIYIDNRFEINWPRVTVILMFAIAGMALLLFAKELSKRLENMFLVVAIGLGVAFLSLLPNQKVSWDEGIHFRNAYETSLQSKVGYHELLIIHSNDDKVWPLNIPQTYEEGLLLDDFIDENFAYEEGQDGVVMVDNRDFSIKNIGYWPSGLGLTIGRLLKLDFTDLFVLGRVFNLVAYLVLAYFAIRKCAIGKVLMTVIALMPTLMITATTYTRDAVLNGCALLGLAYLFSMIAQQESKISWKDYIVFGVSIFVVCLIKPVYAPLLMLVLLIPKDRFKDKKDMYIMKAGVFLIALLLVLSFVVPTLTASENIGDPRGGNTSGTGQLDYIFGDPLAYTKLLLSSIVTNFVTYTFGVGVLGQVGHIIEVAFPGVLALFMLVLALTDKNEAKVGGLMKLGILACSFVIMCFVWTSMYLSYTEVGANVIAGVQGRYFIPVVYPLLLLLNIDRFKLNLSKTWYPVAAVVVTMGFEFYAMYGMLIAYGA